ncbi:hypothetical protein EIN_207030 [Entamoeba invadens IP1]|uniref:Uncharacterized protein n=1 Tax=Entamoeba invadens IP1 TaxID=370355 RepID=A0A0A1U9K3_ENTIV|nr:hypothetical protein EIN_207030 [Entamoeba invadens IP1]ELP91666.1 hypothetical protein EIN_207030 [Entamoeba invadens IP1]|eukprot:XP_004258437.1 hypothetical protein EIN_207030 [Entamoeba invadens IP1]
MRVLFLIFVFLTFVNAISSYDFAEDDDDDLELNYDDIDDDYEDMYDDDFDDEFEDDDIEDEEDEIEEEEDEEAENEDDEEYELTQRMPYYYDPLYGYGMGYYGFKHFLPSAYPMTHYYPQKRFQVPTMPFYPMNFYA